MAAALLEKPIEYLKGVGPNRGTLLRNELGIDTCKDLLYHFPNRYVDRTRFYSIAELPKAQADVQIIGISAWLITPRESVSLLTFKIQLEKLNLFGFGDINGFKNSSKQTSTILLLVACCGMDLDAPLLTPS